MNIAMITAVYAETTRLLATPLKMVAAEDNPEIAVSRLIGKRAEAGSETHRASPRPPENEAAVRLSLD
jgi:hypothetical protein